MWKHDKLPCRCAVCVWTCAKSGLGTKANIHMEKHISHVKNTFKYRCLWTHAIGWFYTFNVWMWNRKDKFHMWKHFGKCEPMWNMSTCFLSKSGTKFRCEISHFLNKKPKFHMWKHVGICEYEKDVLILPSKCETKNLQFHMWEIKIICENTT